MAGDLFSGLGGLVKGLSNFMPQNDPNVQMLSLQSEVGELKQQETEIFAEIGKLAVERYGLSSFGDCADRLMLVQKNLAAANAKLSELNSAQQAESAAKAAFTCPQCGTENPEGTKFCNECGAKLPGTSKTFCVSCGAELAPGIRFCGACGAKQEA